ncbi:MAG: ATP synthase F1 subunit epsilon [Clostridiales bacterium]|nr:ATP synthase F1 subunit epsilon [Candidatus Cacconaster stercorequi]
MKDQIHLRIVTAGGTVYDGQCSYVELPLEGGGIGVLSDHAPTIGAVCDGVVKSRSDAGEECIAVGQGVVNIAHNEIIVLTRTAECAENIDVQRAADAERRARERLTDKNGEWDTMRAEAALYRAIARQNAVRMSGRE